VRHKVFGKKLSRDTKARKALLRNVANSLVIHNQLTTTLAKAKFAAPYIEKLVTQAKRNRLSSNRWLASTLSDDAFRKIIQELGPGFSNRQGGYTRVIKLAPRRGDSAPMARLEFVEWDKSKTPPQTKPKKKIEAKIKAKGSKVQ